MLLTGLSNEPVIRLSIFLSLFTIFAMWELLRPIQQSSKNKLLRWVSNLGLMLINTVVLRLVFPLAAVGLAALAHEHNWGLLNNTAATAWVKFIIGLLILDISIYWQHRLFHVVPLFWRLHKVHHTDTELDVTTAVRFHPLEILLSMLIKFIIITTFGIPILAVLLFEILLSSTALFNHANISINTTIEKWLRYIFVTPNMHWIHHSTLPKETDSNFSFNFSVWDKLFGSYCHRSEYGGIIKLGLKEYRNPQSLKLHRLLGIPFSQPLSKDNNEPNS